jgi:hypothetical protein
MARALQAIVHENATAKEAHGIFMDIRQEKMSCA